MGYGMKKKNISLTGIDTPVGGLSWNTTPSTAMEIKRILLLLNSKRILVAPIVDSFNRWGRQTYERKSEPNYVSMSILEIRDFITHQQIEKVIDNTIAIDLLGEMIQACNVFLDSWETFNNIFVVEQCHPNIFLNSLEHNATTEIDTKKYVSILLHNAGVVSNFREIMQQKADELIKIFQIDLHIEFPTQFNEKNFKLPI